MIEIDGKKYKVIEDGGFQAGYQTKFVVDNGTERVAVKRDGRWTWWTTQDRLLPLLSNPPKGKKG